MSNDSAARGSMNRVPEHKEAKLSDDLEKRIKADALAVGAIDAVVAAPGIAQANIVKVNSSFHYSSPVGIHFVTGGLNLVGSFKSSRSVGGLYRGFASAKARLSGTIGIAGKRSDDRARGLRFS